MRGPTAFRAAAIVLLVASGAALAGIAVTSTSTLTLGVREPPVHFSVGVGAERGRYVSDVSVTPNGTSFGATITGRLGGDATVKNVVRLVSVAGADRSVELRGTQVTNPNVPIHTWTLRSGATTIAVLDMRTASPGATFTLPAGATYDLDMRVKVLRGVAANEASFVSSVWAVVG